MIQQGDIYWAVLDPARGREQQGIRPCLIVSGNTMNQYLEISLICPLTTSLKNYLGGVILEPNQENGLKKTSEVLVYQIRTLDHLRLKEKIGCVTPEQVQKIHSGIALVLKH